MRAVSAALIAVVASVSAAAQTAPAPKIERNVETRIIGQEMSGGGYLGVELRDISKDNYAQYGLSEVRGVAIEKVTDLSPASKAGLQKGDVVVRFDGESVASARKLQRLVSEVAPDHQAKLTVIRGGKETDVTVTVGKREASIADGNFLFKSIPDLNMPDVQIIPNGQGDFNLRIPRIEGAPDAGGNIERRVIVMGGRQIGVGVAPLTKQLGDYFGVSDGKGLLINEVRENSPAAKAGLKAGDVIVSADGKEVGDADDLVELVNSKKEGDVTLTFIRNKKKESVKVTPETAKDDGNQRKIERVIINGGPIS